MTRAVSPNPSAQAEWLLAGIIDRALKHCGHVPPLDGGIGHNDHADPETDTAIPDDDEDTILLPLPVNRLCLSSHQVSSGARLPRGAFFVCSVLNEVSAWPEA